MTVEQQVRLELRRIAKRAAKWAGVSVAAAGVSLFMGFWVVKEQPLFAAGSPGGGPEADPEFDATDCTDEEVPRYNSTSGTLECSGGVIIPAINDTGHVRVNASGGFYTSTTNAITTSSGRLRLITTASNDYCQVGTTLWACYMDAVQMFDMRAAYAQFLVPIILDKQEGTAPTEPFACDGDVDVGATQYVDDTDDGLKGEVCVCIATADDSAGNPTAWDWRKIDDLTAACLY